MNQTIHSHACDWIGCSDMLRIGLHVVSTIVINLAHLITLYVTTFNQSIIIIDSNVVNICQNMQMDNIMHDSSCNMAS